MESELKQNEGILSELQVVEMSTGDRLLCKGEAVYVPASLRTQMVDTLHLTHAADQSMLESAKNRIYWPGLRKQLHVKYQTCKECSYNRISQTRPANECSQSNLFENFFPNSYLQADFLQFNDTDIMVVVDTLTGFGKAYKTKNKTTEEAIKVMRSLIAQWG